VRLEPMCLVALLSLTTATAGAQQAASAERIRAALAIPREVDTLRLHGVPEDQVRIVVDEARKRRLPSTETRDILVEANRDARDHGPVNNFGAFVQAQLASGKRGRALATAIRAEHVRRGIGKGKTNFAATANGSRTRAGATKTSRGTDKVNTNARTRAGASGSTKASPGRGVSRSGTVKAPAKSTTPSNSKTRGPAKPTTKAGRP
jgi:hypothetical protein